MSGNTSATGGFLAPQDNAATLEGDDLRNLLQELVVGCTGLAGALVRPRWQPTPPTQPAPETNWCAVGVVSRSPEGGEPWVGHNGAGDGGLGVDVLRRHETLDILASFYGPNSSAMAARLFNGLYINQNRETLELNNAGLVGAGDVIAVPDLTNLQWINRHDLPFVIRREVTNTYLVRNLLEAPFEIITE